MRVSFLRISAATRARQAVRLNLMTFAAMPLYPLELVGEKTRTSVNPISFRIFFNRGAYWPNRQGPEEVGRKKAVFSGTKFSLLITFRKFPRVMRWGRHSSPVVQRPARASVLSSEWG